MSDSRFQWSMILITVIMILWIIVGIVSGVFNVAFVFFSGLIIWMILSGLLIHYWGKSYMSRE